MSKSCFLYFTNIIFFLQKFFLELLPFLIQVTQKGTKNGCILTCFSTVCWLQNEQVALIHMKQTEIKTKFSFFL